MNHEVFFELKEIESLHKMELGHLKTIQEQRDRLLTLQEQLTEKENNIKILKVEVSQLSTEQLNIEARLKDRLDSQTKADLEKSQWDLMVKIEISEETIKDHFTFIDGFKKTILEITNEANEIIQKEEFEIKNIHLRINLLQEGLPEDVQSLLKKLQKLNLKFGIFTSIQDASCRFCRSRLSKVEEQEIDVDLKLKTCKSCQRLFLPYNIVSR